MSDKLVKDAGNLVEKLDYAQRSIAQHRVPDARARLHDALHNNGFFRLSVSEASQQLTALYSKRTACIASIAALNDYVVWYVNGNNEHSEAYSDDHEHKTPTPETVIQGLKSVIQRIEESESNSWINTKIGFWYERGTLGIFNGQNVRSILIEFKALSAQIIDELESDLKNSSEIELTSRLLIGVSDIKPG
jgi:hypothetical protein